MTFLQERLQKMGATQSQIMSNTVKLVQKAIDEEAGFVDKAAMAHIERIAETFEHAKEYSEQIKGHFAEALVSAKMEAEQAKREINGAVQRYENAKKQADGLIQDREMADAVKAYKAVLEATKEVFGDSCTPEVIQEAIRAGSYTAWRGIMGPKDQQPYGKRI